MSRSVTAPLWRNLPGMLSRPETAPFPGIVGTFMARDALALAASYVDIRRDDRVLLPAYLCKEVLRAFASRSRVEFYDLTDDLTADPITIEKVLACSPVRMVVIINYFGFLQPFRREIAELCATRRVVLLEDCAHSLLTNGSAEAGDFAVFSFRKTLPVADGGGLLIRTPTTAAAVRFHPRLYSNVLSSLALAKALLDVRSTTFSRAGISSRLATPAVRDGRPAQRRVSRRFLPLSSFAYNGIGHVSFPQIVERRRRDYSFWQEFATTSRVLQPLFSKLEPGVCPLGFPVKVENRDLVRARLQKQGIPVSVHWPVPDGVGSSFRISHRVAQQVLTLPVYPELDETARDRIMAVLSALHD